MRKLTEQQRADRLAKLAALRAEIAAYSLAVRTERAHVITREHAAEHAARMAKRDKSGGFAFLPLLALLALGAVAAIAGHAAELRVRESSALHCARMSDGADSSIADCYASRDLPLPERI